MRRGLTGSTTLSFRRRVCILVLECNIQAVQLSGRSAQSSNRAVRACFGPTYFSTCKTVPNMGRGASVTKRGAADDDCRALCFKQNDLHTSVILIPHTQP